MRVAFLTNVVYPFVTGGAEKRVHEIGTRLAADGHDVSIYGKHFWDGPREMQHEGVTLRAVAADADLYADEPRSISEAIDFATRAVCPVRKRLTRDEHDLVVASVFPYFPVLLAKLATVGTNVPLVTTWHEVWRDYWTDYLSHLAPCGKLVESLTARIPQHPVAVSGVTADRLTEIDPSRADIEVVSNGIDIEQIRGAPLPEERNAESYDVLFAGRLISDKNVDVLLEAFDTIANRHDATLGIIGDGPEVGMLQEQTSNLMHGDRVEFLGFLDEYEDVLGQMRAAQVFASPSTREEFGITLAEAMTAGCTVIAAAHPESAADEVVGDGGFIIESSVDRVADALDRALSGERPVDEPTERAANFDWDNVANQAEACYARAIDGRW